MYEMPINFVHFEFGCHNTTAITTEELVPRIMRERGERAKEPGYRRK